MVVIIYLRHADLKTINRGAQVVSRLLWGKIVGSSAAFLILGALVGSCQFADFVEQLL